MSLLLKNFTNLNAQEAELVLRWRNHKHVADFMRQKSIAKAEHLDFIESLKHDSSREYFLVFDDAIPVGVIDFVSIVRGESCEFGIYQSPFLKGYGEVLMREVLRYAFEVLAVRVICARVFRGNTKALELYLRFGFNDIQEDDEMCYLSLSARRSMQ